MSSNINENECDAIANKRAENRKLLKKMFFIYKTLCLGYEVKMIDLQTLQFKKNNQTSNVSPPPVANSSRES
jgi:hypothetical protein